MVAWRYVQRPASNLQHSSFSLSYVVHCLMMQHTFSWVPDTRDTDNCWAVSQKLSSPRRCSRSQCKCMRSLLQSCVLRPAVSAFSALQGQLLGRPESAGAINADGDRQDVDQVQDYVETPKDAQVPN